jgi:hypothetical protein
MVVFALAWCLHWPILTLGAAGMAIAGTAGILADVVMLALRWAKDFANE